MSTRRAAALAVLLSTCWLLAMRASALAHSRLVGSSPSAGEDLPRAPKQVQLRFDQRVDVGIDPLKVYGPSGQRVDREDARPDPGDPRVLAASLEDLPQGSYEVEYRVTSLDGHVVEGAYDFAVSGAGEQEARGRPQQGAGDGAGRYTGYGALGVLALVVLGGVGATLLRRGAT